MNKCTDWYNRFVLWANAHPLLFFVLLVLFCIAIYIGIEASHGH